jgi:hypothetical protein
MFISSFHTEPFADGRGLHVTAPGLTIADAIARLRTDPAFRTELTSLLTALPYTAFRWETPPVTASTTHKPFEFVVLNGPGLDRRQDAEAFAEHFTDEPVVAFANLSGDAMMVVPCPRDSGAKYTHLASFLRTAPAGQIDALWVKVAEAVERCLGDRPLWLSTAGGGVAWLHVRLDNQPKYYGHAPYRRP